MTRKHRVFHVITASEVVPFPIAKLHFGFVKESIRILNIGNRAFPFGQRDIVEILANLQVAQYLLRDSRLCFGLDSKSSAT